MRFSLTAAALVSALTAASAVPSPAWAKPHGDFFHSGRAGLFPAGRMGFSRQMHVPPGWGRGFKVGWGGRHMPPGLRRR